MASIHRRGKHFHVKFSFRGKQFFRALKTSSKKEALHAKNRVEQNMHLITTGVLEIPPYEDIGDFILIGKPKMRLETKRSISNSLFDTASIYLKTAQSRKATSSYKTEQIHLRHFLAFLGDDAKLAISGITSSIIDEYVVWRRESVGPNTVNKELQTISQMFRFAIERDLYNNNPINPGHRFKKAGVPHRFMTRPEINEQIKRGGLTDKEEKDLMRFRYLKMDEITELLKLSKRSPLHPLIALLAYTGMRRGEALSLEWKDVDLKRKKILVRSRKQSSSVEFTGRDIDIHPKLLPILKKLHKTSKKGKYVFSNNQSGYWDQDSAYRQFKNLIAGTSFEGIGFHCFRHSFASNLAALGVDQRIIDHFMGHQTEEIRRRYQHLFPASRRKAIDSLDY